MQMMHVAAVCFVNRAVIGDPFTTISVSHGLDTIPIDALGDHMPLNESKQTSHCPRPPGMHVYCS